MIEENLGMSDVLRAVVDALYIYPVKVCAGLRVHRLQFSAEGLVTVAGGSGRSLAPGAARYNRVDARHGQPPPHRVFRAIGRVEYLKSPTRPARCDIVPNVGSCTATVSEQPLKTVTRPITERHPGKPAYFGINALAQQAATLPEDAQLELVLNF